MSNHQDYILLHPLCQAQLLKARFQGVASVSSIMSTHQDYILLPEKIPYEL